jgi:hypothetical protein
MVADSFVNKESRCSRGLTKHSGGHSKVNAAGFRAVGLDRDGGMIAGLQLMFPVFLPLIHGRNHESKHGH